MKPAYWRFTAALLTTANLQNQLRSPSWIGWVRKCSGYAHNGILFSLKGK
jgi:hypothetical protein